jgi:hypothetical protein
MGVLNGEGKEFVNESSPEAENHPSRRAFMLVAASGLATIGVGVLGGIGLSATTNGRMLGRQVNDTADSDELSDLSGTEDDASAALQRFLASAGPSVVLSGQFVIDSAIEVPYHVQRVTFAPGSALKVRGNHNAIKRTGSITFLERTGHSMKEGAEHFVSDSPGRYSTNDYLLLSGSNTVKNSKDRYGYLRRVTSVRGDRIYIDRPLPRVIDKDPRTSSVRLAPTIRIDGSGEIYNLNPREGKSSLVTLRAVEAPEVSGIEVHSNGGIGVTVAHCHGGKIDCTVRDLLDDGEEFFGYGVNVSGSSRDVVVAGFIARVRHAVTTNAGGLIDEVGHAGEPEDCTFAPRAEDCSNKAIDTHRLGWGILMIPNVKGGSGGVQVRADNTTVRGGSVADVTVSGVTIAEVVSVSATVSGVSITNVQDGIGIRCRGPADISDCVISDTPGVAVEMNDGSTVDGLDIRNGGDVGIQILGSDNSVKNVRVDGSAERVVSMSSQAADNTVSVSSIVSSGPIHRIRFR